jgi:flagellar biosynthesis protein
MNQNDNKEKIKKRTAVALSYDPDETAPKIIASGKGYVADKIIKLANEDNIPIHKDDALADTLSRLELGSYIPTELYEVVAEILVFVDKMDRLKGKVM